ncbi:MAG: hypothetical protein JW891_16675 [Candidatus Lokiarchaeota archaeon]|nr:hypothetical protein [Candidatus Lokiarchaeota archaeon]
MLITVHSRRNFGSDLERIIRIILIISKGKITSKARNDVFQKIMVKNGLWDGPPSA